MTRPSTGSEALHQQPGLTLVLSVSEALLLKSVLPRLVQGLDGTSARNPQERESRRELQVVALLVQRLNDSLPPCHGPIP